jgi:hypothetical protein
LRAKYPLYALMLLRRPKRFAGPRAHFLRVLRIAPAALSAAAAWLGVACREPTVDAEPAMVVEAFIDRMRAVHGDPAKALSALELLAKGARTNLEERAARASAAAGRPVTPEEMLAPSRFSLVFEPVEYRAETRGKWSRVTVYGANAGQERFEVTCALEEQGWRVVVDPPPLPLIERHD